VEDRSRQQPANLSPAKSFDPVS